MFGGEGALTAAVLTDAMQEVLEQVDEQGPRPPQSPTDPQRRREPHGWTPVSGCFLSAPPSGCCRGGPCLPSACPALPCPPPSVPAEKTWLSCSGPEAFRVGLGAAAQLAELAVGLRWP